MTHEISTYADALTYLYSFADYERTTPRAHDTLRLSTVATLLAAVGNPHHRLRCIHIAGTKGKGSTGAMLTSILRAAGYSVGTYTSPHLHTHRERYQLEGEPVGEEDFTQLLAELKPAIDRVNTEHAVTTFEVSTVLAFELFARKRVDWAVIEVGMGGRLDTTNVIVPVLSVITSISLDHTEVLGDTLELIAREKAGIIKPGVPVVVAPQGEEARGAILERAHETSSRALVVDDLIAAADREIIDSYEQQFTLHTQLQLNGHALDRRRVSLNLLGAHQVDNALTAIVACTALGEAGAEVGIPGIVSGLSQVRWPGRFEVAPGAIPIVIDGAHNPDSVAKLRRTMQEVFPGRQVSCVFGTGRGHDAAGMMAQLKDFEMVLCQATHPRATTVEDLATIAESQGVTVQAAEPSVDAAIRVACVAANVQLVLVCGSLFVAAEAREALGLAAASDPITH